MNFNTHICTLNDVEMVEILIKDCFKVNITRKDNHLMYPLCTAIIVSKLIESGAGMGQEIFIRIAKLKK